MTETKATLTQAVSKHGATAAAPIVTTPEAQKALDTAMTGFVAGNCGRLTAAFVSSIGTKEFVGIDFKQTPFGAQALGAVSFNDLRDMSNLVKAGIDLKHGAPIVSAEKANAQRLNCFFICTFMYSLLV